MNRPLRPVLSSVVLAFGILLVFAVMIVAGEYIKGGVSKERRKQLEDIQRICSDRGGIQTFKYNDEFSCKNGFTHQIRSDK